MLLRPAYFVAPLLLVVFGIVLVTQLDDWLAPPATVDIPTGTTGPVVVVVPDEPGMPEQTGVSAREILKATLAGEPFADRPLPLLRFDAGNALLPESRMFLEELGHVLRRLGPERSMITFATRSVPGITAAEVEQAEAARIRTAYEAIALTAAEAAPMAVYDPPPQTPQEIGPTLEARLSVMAAPGAGVEQPPAEPEAAPLPPQDPGPIEDLSLGEALDLPDLTFLPGQADLTAQSAAMLAELADRTDAVGANRFRLFLMPQTTPGLSPDDEVQTEIARFGAIDRAMAGDAGRWGGAQGFGPSPDPVIPLPDRIPAAIVLVALPDAPPPEWKATPGAPSGYDAMAFVPNAPLQTFPISDPRLTASSEGMIDLWTSPEWTQQNGYDPVVFEIGSGDDVTVSLHILDNRKGLAIWTGVPGLLLSVAHDFTENRPYHIAVLVTPDGMQIMVDGQMLRPAIPLPLGRGAPVQITVGNDSEGLAPYVGRIGRVRLWHAIPAVADLNRLPSLPDLIPGETDRLASSASSVIWLNPETDRMEMRLAPLQLAPDEGWWAPLAGGDIRLLNADEFNRGSEGPVFSDMQDDWQDANLSVAAQPRNPADPGAFGPIEDAQMNPHFALRHAFRLIADDGIDLDALRIPVPPEARFAVRMSWQRNDPNWGLRIVEGANGVEQIKSSHCSTSRRVGDRWTCPDPLQANETMIVFDTDEYLTGIFWLKTTLGIRHLVFFTNKRETQPLAGKFQPGERTEKIISLALPAGVTPAAFTVHSVENGGRPVGLSLDFAERHSRPGITLVTETGTAIRFVRQWEDSYVSAEGNMGPLLAFPGAWSVRDPSLHVLDHDRIRIDGVPDEILLWPDRPAAQPGTAFNDTFVSLSKAVNLQASYMGYDAVEMDPLHLIRTGTHHPVFRMPDGNTSDYYDANRIFVPRGLHYFPEFTGKHHASVTTSDTYAEYFDSFSATVSFGIGGKAAPGSFSASATMSGARKSISEAKNSRTRGLSRAAFYDLILDPQQMELDDLFMSEAARLFTSGGYDAFIDTFGTHYPVGVVYGGLGVLEIDATETMRETMRQQGIAIKMEASVLLDAASKTSASFGFEHKSEHATTFRDVMGSQVENFYWIGGTHAGASNSGWTVGTDGVVPVYVQLRPLWELLSPVYFDDPVVYGQTRERLRLAINRRIAAAAANVPGGQDDDHYVVELRVDAVTCTSDPATSMREPAQANTTGGVQLTAKPLQVFPMIGMAVIDGNQGLLRNLEAHDVDSDSDYKPIATHCPSQINLLERSPYAAANALFRFEMSAEDILSGRSSMIILDRLDLESLVLTPPVDAKSTEVKTKSFLAGLTLGISVLIDELTTEEGSPLVRAGQSVYRPKLEQVSRSLLGRLCAPGTACPRERADLDRLSGQWIRQSENMVRPCPEIARSFGASVFFFCVPRRVDYSVRIVK